MLSINAFLKCNKFANPLFKSNCRKLNRFKKVVDSVNQEC